MYEGNIILKIMKKYLTAACLSFIVDSSRGFTKRLSKLEPWAANFEGKLIVFKKKKKR